MTDTTTEPASRTPDVIDLRRQLLKTSRGGNYYGRADVDQLLADLKIITAGLEGQRAELEASLVDLRQRYTEAAGDDQAVRMRVARLMADARRDAEALVGSAQLRAAQVIEDARHRAAQIMDAPSELTARRDTPASGVPAPPDPSGNQVADTLAEARHLEAVRSYLAGRTEAVRQEIRDTVQALHEADALLDGAPVEQPAGEWAGGV